MAPFKFSVLTLHWFEDKWLVVGGIETPDNFGALFYIGRIWGGFWEWDLLWTRMIVFWLKRKYGL